MPRSAALLLLAVPLCALACGGGLDSHDESALPVTTIVMARAPFEPQLALVGVVAPAASADLLVPAAGIVAYPSRFAAGLVTGAVVTANEPLMTISSLERKRELSLARVSAEGAAEELARMERAFSLGVLPQVDVARARAQSQLAEARRSSAEHEAAALVLRAPVGGRLVIGLPIPSGSEVRQGDLVGHIAGAGALRVEAQAAAAELGRLRPGQRVRFLAPGTTTMVGEGIVRAVAPVVDTTGTVTVLAEVTGGVSMPPPGDGVDLEIALEQRSAALTVPEEAIAAGGGGSSVFVLARLSGGYLRARHRVVRTGDHGDGKVEILDGLTPGDRVVVTGVAALRDNMVVVALPATPPAHQPGAGNP